MSISRSILQHKLPVQRANLWARRPIDTRSTQGGLVPPPSRAQTQTRRSRSEDPRPSWVRPLSVATFGREPGSPGPRGCSSPRPSPTRSTRRTVRPTLGERRHLWGRHWHAVHRERQRRGVSRPPIRKLRSMSFRPGSLVTSSRSTAVPRRGRRPDRDCRCGCPRPGSWGANRSRRCRATGGPTPRSCRSRDRFREAVEARRPGVGHPRLPPHLDRERHLDHGVQEVQ
jgi:hypothetical protein